MEPTIEEIETTKRSLAGATSSVGARAVLAGALVTLASQFLFISFGAAVGLSTKPKTTGAGKGVLIWMIVWTLATIAVSGFLGGWVSSLAARSPARLDGMLNGFVTWALVALFVTLGLGNLVANAVATAFGLMGTAPQAANVDLGQATSAAGLSMWFFFVLLGVPLITSLLGGAFGARGIERRLHVARRPIGVTEHETITTTPQPPVPSPV
jgi:hypothetical protein